ncbi:MAG: hypothetical protein K1V80_04770 [Muribaculaceae bacterium]
MDEIIKVTFHNPVNGEREYFFTSAAAIYQHFTAEQIGLSLARLWGKHLSVASPIATKTCVISKHYIHRKPQANKRK